MIGKLDPEENVMSDSFRFESKLLERINELGWDSSDNIVIEIGGSSVSGIDVGDNYNEKWQSPIGTKKYNKDAFIVIKNLSRTPFEPSQPMEEFKPKHPYKEN